MYGNKSATTVLQYFSSINSDLLLHLLNQGCVATAVGIEEAHLRNTNKTPKYFLTAFEFALVIQCIVA